MMAKSTKSSNQRPDTLMQDRTSANSMKVFLQRTAGPYMWVIFVRPARSRRSRHIRFTCKSIQTLAPDVRYRRAFVEFQHRHGARRIKRSKCWCKLLPVAQIDLHGGNREPLLGKKNPHPTRAWDSCTIVSLPRLRRK